MKNASSVAEKTTLENGKFLNILQVVHITTTALETIRP